MGTLGRYLHDARQARGIDLRDAAQQTRISIQYLKALEEEDFSKLPGEVFVRGFLKSYAKFLRLDESDVMMKYGELGKKPAPAAVPVPSAEPSGAAPETKEKPSAKIPIEPFLWGAGIVVILVLFLFTAVPTRQPKETHQAAEPAQAEQTGLVSEPVPTTRAVKLYLEVVALENTWILVRTDTSPQKKAVLNKGDSLIWSADERFLLSYGRADAVKLLLNGEELTVNAPKDVVIRDLIVTASGIVNRSIQSERPRPVKPKPQPAAEAQPAEPPASASGSQQAPEPAPPQPQSEPEPAPQNSPWEPSPNPAP